MAQLLIEDIQTFLSKYVFLPSDEATLVLSLFVAHTWRYDAAYATPYIYLHSPEPQSGKTKCLEVMGTLVKNPMMGASLTDAVTFRAIEEFEPTLILDEVDTVFNGSKNEPMRAVLNSGYRHSGHVWRVEKSMPRRFMTYCPKLLAGIQNLALPETIRDRSIPIRMRRKPKSVQIEPFYLRDVRGSRELESILSRLELWSQQHYEDLLEARPEPIREISDRQWEISEPLISIADLFGNEDEARKALVKLFEESAEQEGVSEQTQLLVDIAEAFKIYGMKRISSRILLEKLGRDWSGKKLANSIACYGIHPKPLRINNEVVKGYEFNDFKPIFESYL